MTLIDVMDTLGLLCLVAGALLCLAAAAGLLRFPDLLTRMHAAAKPQVLGVLLVLAGVGLRTRSGLDIGMLVLIGLFQMLTVPVGAHMVGRAAYRVGISRQEVGDRPAWTADSRDGGSGRSHPEEPEPPQAQAPR